MSGEGNWTEQPSTTTVSSVAIQAGDSRIIISIVKCGETIQLQLAEAVPNLLEIGANQEEAEKLLQDHNVLLYKIKALEDQVWDLLCQADETAEQYKDQSQVYDAMAATLKEAWASLISVLEKRRDLLFVTFEFFHLAAQVSDAIDNAETFLQNLQDTANSIPECLQLHQQHTKMILERSLAVMNKSQEVTEFIQQFKSQQPVARSEMIKGARCSCTRIEELLESLQDRRRNLDMKMRQQRQRLEQGMQLSQWHQQAEKVICLLSKQIELYLTNIQLGASLTENEELLHKHKQLVLNSKESMSAVEGLKREAKGLLLERGNAAIQDLSNSNDKLTALHAEFWKQMDQKHEVLLEANDFFKCVNKAFDKLGGIESYLKHLKMQNVSLPELSAKQKETEAEIQECTSEAFQKGDALLKKLAFNPGMNGIQEMIGYLQKRVDQLTSQSPESTENSLDQQDPVASLEDQLLKTSTWIQNINLDLEKYSNPGWSVGECEKVMKKLEELANQTKEASQVMESATQLIQNVPYCSELYASNSCLLDERLKALDQSIEEKLEVINVYVTFLKSSKQLESHIHNLKKFWSSEPEEGTTVTLELAETRIQNVLDELFSVQDMGQNCLNIIKMMNKNRILKDKHVQTVEDTMANLNEEKIEITNLWSAWQQHANQTHSCKLQWRTIKDQLKLARSRFQELENDLHPLSSVSLGNDIQNILNAQENLNNIKTKFQDLNNEMEQAVKISELLAREGTQTQSCEKIGMINDLAQYHQKLNDSIKEYEEIFIKILAFYKMRTEINIIKAEMEPLANGNLQGKRQEQQEHIQSLYKIVLNLGSQIISSIHHSKQITIPLNDLQQELDDLQRESVIWVTNKPEEKPTSFDTATSLAEVNELRESFKDLKKKFNNLKFNYTKKADKGRNLKVIKNQIQQVEMYSEKIQALKKKIENLEKKIGAEAPKTDSSHEAICELQKNMTEFNRVAEDYKVYLEMAEDLHHIMEESQFWCEEACATVVRVGRYSAECKTKDAVEVLLKQFNKFVHPTLPQQEERVQQMVNIAKHIYGVDDGPKYIEKTLAKHKEAVLSVNDLCTYLKELEDKLEEPKKVPEISVSDENGEITGPSGCAKEGSITGEAELPPELLADEAVSGDDYECISPDDISLPPLAETPESNLPQSENEQDEQHCLSSHSMHVSSYSLQMQMNTSSKRLMDGSEYLSPAAYTDLSSNKKNEKTSSSIDRFCSPTVGYKTDSPYSHHSTVVSETRYSLNSSPAKAKPTHRLTNEVHETHLQRCSVYESTDKTEQLHASDNTLRTKDRLHAAPDEFSGLMFQSGTAKSSQRHTVTQEAIRSLSEKHNSVSPAGLSPGFSKHFPNVTVKEGSPVTLEVEVTGYPEPTLTWSRKNKKHSNNDYEISTGKETSRTFIIQELSSKASDHHVAHTSVFKATMTSGVEANIKGINQLISEVNWITLLLMYICVSILYWIFS